MQLMKIDTLLKFSSWYVGGYVGFIQTV